MEKYRNTLQRDIVLNAIKDLVGTHPTTDQVFKHVAEKYPNIGRSTVYRNINILSEQGKVLKIDVPNEAERIDANFEFHYHIYCEECGKVFDVDMPYLSNLEDNILDKQGFEFKSHKIIFIGVCPDCKNKNYYIEKEQEK